MEGSGERGVVSGGVVCGEWSVSYGEWGDVDCRFPRAENRS